MTSLKHSVLTTFRALSLGLLCALALCACERRSGDTVGASVVSADTTSTQVKSHPAPLRQAREVYRNVPLLGELDIAEFDRSMVRLTQWVAPANGCTHCHVAGDYASEDKPAKQVARRMLLMTQHINADWKPHVGSVGVTCHTCHRGLPVPAGGDSFFLPAAQVKSPGAALPHDRSPRSADCAWCHQSPDWDTPPGEQATRLDRAASGERLLHSLNTEALEPLPATAVRTVDTGAERTSTHRCATCHHGQLNPTSEDAPKAEDHPAMTLVALERGIQSEQRAAAAAPASERLCSQAATAAARAGVRIPAEAGLAPVLGAEPLRLFAAPDSACLMLDLHLQAGDTVEAFVTHAGFTSVRYRRTSTGSEARGWVRSDRLGPASVVPPVFTARFVLPGAKPAALNVPVHCGNADVGPALAVRARRQVLGQGRLQFYASPDEACPMRGIFILPGEPVVAVQQASRFTAVLYANPRTGGQASGWVLSERLGGG